MYKVIYRLGLVFVLCGGYLLYVEANSDTNAIPRPIVDPGAQGKPANELSPAPAVESVENVQSPPMSDATAGFPVEGAGQNIPQPISEAVPAPEATSANASMPTAPAAPPAIAEPAPETKAPTEEVPALPPSPVPASVVSVPNEVNQKKRATRISAARKNEPEAVSAPTLQPTELPVGLKTEKITTAPAVEEKKT